MRLASVVKETEQLRKGPEAEQVFRTAGEVRIQSPKVSQTECPKGARLALSLAQGTLCSGRPGSGFGDHSPES